MFSNKLILSIFITVLSLTITACSTLGISDGSLDYRKKKIIAPLNMAGESVNVFRPLYVLPVYEAVDNSSALINDKGNRFVMPKATAIYQNIVTGSISKTAPINNKSLTENEKGVPILQLKYELQTAMVKVAHILKKSNFSVVKSQNNSYLIITHKQLQGKRLLRFKTTASTTKIIVTNVNNTIADVKEARYVLNKVYKGLK